ncbi:MAG: ATP-binding cassette domain-containing protein [Acidimicrobiia bacterium]|nr:ATP-binding cassette domain-containing protein [Acidimicrobiia bacterium]
MGNTRRRATSATRGATSGKIAKGDLRQMRRLIAFIKPYRRQMIYAVIGIVIAAGLGLVFPRILGNLVDSALSPATPGDTTALDRLALLLIGVFAAQALFTAIRVYYLSAVGEGVVADLRTAVYRHLMTLSVRFFDSRKTGEITSRLTSDVSVVQATVSIAVAQAISQVVTLVGGVTLMFITSITLTAYVLSFVPIAIITATWFGRRLRRISTGFQDLVAEANAAAEESISAVRVVKWFSAEKFQVARYSEAVGRSYAIALKRARIRAFFTPIVTFVAFATLAVILWLGGRQVLAGDLSVGDLVSFLVYTLTVAGAIGTFSGLYGQLQEALGSTQRIFELLDEKNDLPQATSPKRMPRVSGHVRFNDVTFRYSDRDVEVLRRISLDVRPGEVTAIVGPSGAGKSTMVQMLPRFYDPTGGFVEIDGHDIREVNLADLRSHMAAVPQEVQLFSGTITENLRVGDPKASTTDLVDAATAANAHEFIISFPDGYETLVGERGVKLSGGQRQRLAIARALLKDPRILILDEATSSLDSESEALVQEALDALMKGRTTFVIAHRLSTVRNADRIIVLDGGAVVEEGTHDELIAANGLYADLASRQFTDVEQP